MPERTRYYTRYDLVIIDEFGFDKIERAEAPQAASLLYKIIDARSQKRSTALVTNIDFEAWGEYLGDPPLAMAFLYRIVDGAIILTIKGKSHRSPCPATGPQDNQVAFRRLPLQPTSWLTSGRQTGAILRRH